MYFLTLIIPVYNTERYLRRCVESLATQDGFKKIEVLLIDDGSTDQSGQICDEYSAKYDNVITIHKANGGLSDARNMGISKAAGKYISFLDSDDLVASDFIQDMANLTEEYGPDLINYGYVFEKTEGKYSFSGDKSITEKSRDDVLEDLLKNNIGNQVCFSLYKASLFDGICFPKGRAYEDISTYYRLILKTEKNISLSRTYYVYNIANSGSITKTTTLKNMTDMYDAVTEQCGSLEQYYSEKGTVPEYLRCYKLNELIYIYIKVKREIAPDEASRELIRKIESDINKLGKCDLAKTGNYSRKKYLYYELTHLFKSSEKGDGK